MSQHFGAETKTKPVHQYTNLAQFQLSNLRTCKTSIMNLVSITTNVGVGAVVAFSTTQKLIFKHVTTIISPVTVVGSLVVITVVVSSVDVISVSVSIVVSTTVGLSPEVIRHVQLGFIRQTATKPVIIVSVTGGVT